MANSMLLKYREKLQTARHAMEEAKARLEKEKSSAQQTKDQIDEMVSWADCYAKADIGTRHSKTLRDEIWRKEVEESFP